MSAAQSLTIQLATERRRLDDLVRSGRDTAKCRATISHLEAAVSSQTETPQPNSATNSRLQEDEISRQVEQIAGDRLKAIRAATAPLSNPPSPDDAMDAAVQRDHHEAVANLLQAEEALRAAASRVDITSTEVQSLAQRIQVLEMSRETMARRRARGDTRPEDGDELRLITLDLEALVPHSANAASAYGGATATHDQAHRRRVEADQRLNTVESLIAALDLLRGLRAAAVFTEAVGKALGDRFAELDRPSAITVLNELIGLANSADGRMLTLVEQMAAVSVKAGRMGPTPAWGPSAKLANKIRDLAIQRG